MEATEANIDKSQEADYDWVSVDTNDRPVYKFGDAKRTEGVLVLLSAESLSALGAVINLETGHAIFRNLEPENVVQLERSPSGRSWMDLFEQMPVISNHPLSL